MTVSIRDTETDRLVRSLALKKGVSLTEAVRLAVGNELTRMEQEIPLRERIAAISREVLSYPRTGKLADKAFFDDLSGDL